MIERSANLLVLVKVVKRQNCDSIVSGRKQIKRFIQVVLARPVLSQPSSAFTLLVFFRQQGGLGESEIPNRPSAPGTTTHSHDRALDAPGVTGNICVTVALAGR